MAGSVQYFLRVFHSKHARQQDCHYEYYEGLKQKPER